MNPGERIAEAVYRVVKSELRVYDATPGKCLRVTREAIMNALSLSYDEFYARFRTHTVADNPDPALHKWARDVMLSLRNAGFRVAYDEDNPLIYADLMPGDLLCSWKLGEPEGHIAVCLTGGPDAQVLENTGSQRGTKLSGYNRLSRADELTLNYPGSWEVFRLPEDFLPAPQPAPDTGLELPLDLPDLGLDL